MQNFCRKNISGTLPFYDMTIVHELITIFLGIEIVLWNNRTPVRLEGPLDHLFQLLCVRLKTKNEIIILVIALP